MSQLHPGGDGRDCFLSILRFQPGRSSRASRAARAAVVCGGWCSTSGVDFPGINSVAAPIEFFFSWDFATFLGLSSSAPQPDPGDSSAGRNRLSYKPDLDCRGWFKTKSNFLPYPFLNALQYSGSSPRLYRHRSDLVASIRFYANGMCSHWYFHNRYENLCLCRLWKGSQRWNREPGRLLD